MSASFSAPLASNVMLSDLLTLVETLQVLAKQRPDLAKTASIPTDSIMFDTSTKTWKILQEDGKWAALDATSALNINVAKLNGFSTDTGTLKNTIPVRNADGNLPGNITGNANTADSAITITSTLPIEKGGTGATTSANAATNLGVVKKSGDSMGGQLHLASTTDVSASAETEYPLAVGSLTGAHLAIDSDEIMAKASATGTGTLYLNREGGNVAIGSTTSTVSLSGNVHAKSTGLEIGSSTITGTSSAVDSTSETVVATAAAVKKANDAANAATGVTAGTYGSTTALEPAAGGTFPVPYVTVNAAGKLTKAGTVNVTIPSTATKLGSDTVGGTARPIFLNAGAPAAIGTGSIIGGTNKGVYLAANGTITACSANAGGAAQPVYMSGGAVTACTGNVGAATTPVYMKDGVLTACSANMATFSTLKWGSATSYSYGAKFPGRGFGMVSVFDPDDGGTRTWYFYIKYNGSTVATFRNNTRYANDTWYCFPVDSNVSVTSDGGSSWFQGIYIPYSA